MTIERKNIGKLILLNCLTLGIYGAIMHQRMGNEINALCNDDGEEPRVSYIGSVLLTLVPVALFAILGLISANASGGAANVLSMASRYNFTDMQDVGQFLLRYIGTMLGSILFIQPLYYLVGILSVLLKVYREYWWYKQTGRIKLNGWRFGLAIRESGVDTILFRTLTQIPLIVVTAVSYVLHLLVPGIVCLLISLASQTFGIVLFGVFACVFLVFAKDCSAGAYLATYFAYKNINRIIDSGLRVAPFDPMGYEYYPSVGDHYDNLAPHIVYDEYVIRDDLATVRCKAQDTPQKPAPAPAFLDGVRGSQKGYSFPLENGTELFIGRDPSIVIDRAYEKVSGRHVGVRYNQDRDEFYIKDYSTNGTYVDGTKLEKGREYTFHRGSLIELVDSGTSFRIRNS